MHSSVYWSRFRALRVVRVLFAPFCGTAIPPAQVPCPQKNPGCPGDGCLVLPGLEQVVASVGLDCCTPGFLRMHGISTTDTPFDQDRLQQGAGRADLIFFAFDRLLGDDQATFTFIEREPMHRGLAFFVMPQRSPHHFAIHGAMNQLLLLACLWLHSSRLEDHLCHRLSDLLSVTEG